MQSAMRSLLWMVGERLELGLKEDATVSVLNSTRHGESQFHGMYWCLYCTCQTLLLVVYHNMYSVLRRLQSADLNRTSSYTHTQRTYSNEI